jgi:hypothetical protein
VNSGQWTVFFADHAPRVADRPSQVKGTDHCSLTTDHYLKG